MLGARKINSDQRKFIDSAKYMWTTLERCIASPAELIFVKANGKCTERQSQFLGKIAEDEMKADGSYVQRDEKGFKIKT